MAMKLDILACLAEIARRAEVAFATHRKMFTSLGTNQQKLTAYARFITPAALWAAGVCHPYDTLLKGANTLQLKGADQSARALQPRVEARGRPGGPEGKPRVILRNSGDETSITFRSPRDAT